MQTLACLQCQGGKGGKLVSNAVRQPVWQSFSNQRVGGIHAYSQNATSCVLRATALQTSYDFSTYCEKGELYHQRPAHSLNACIDQLRTLKSRSYRPTSSCNPRSYVQTGAAARPGIFWLNHCRPLPLFIWV